MGGEKEIDVAFDFTSDSPNYWDGFWERNSGLGAGQVDPDTASKTLQRYHQILWSRKLPCGETMDLSRGSGPYYLTWKNFRFGSDTIILGFRYQKLQKLLKEVSMVLPDYKKYAEDLVHRAYTIGGTTIFPKHVNSINQIKGTNQQIGDRWDLTLECIRRYYQNEQSPLYETLAKDKEFFDLCVDFKGYVDFFFFQDCVSKDYTTVNIWLGKGEFTESPLPQNAQEYFTFIDFQLDFLNKRNKRIDQFANQ